MKHSFVIALVFWLAATPGWAGFEEGVRAYNSGDYATAFRELLSSAQQGNAVVRKGVKAIEPEASLEGVKFLPRDDDFTKFQLIPERTKRWDQMFFKTSRLA